MATKSRISSRSGSGNSGSNQSIKGGINSNTVKIGTDKAGGLPLGARKAIKWAFFLLVCLILYSLMTTGSGKSSKALLLIPFALAVSCFEAEIPCAALGGFCGILIDMATGQLLGFTGLYLCLVCGIVSGMFRQFLRKNIINYLGLTLAACLIYLYVDYFFFYKIWEYEDYYLIFKLRLLPSHIKTFVLSPLCYLICLASERLSTVKRKLELEEKNEMVDRI